LRHKEEVKMKVIRALARAAALASLSAASIVYAHGAPPIVRDSVQVTTYDGVMDDLLSAGLNDTGLQSGTSPWFLDPLEPTAARSGGPVGLAQPLRRHRGRGVGSLQGLRHRASRQRNRHSLSLAQPRAGRVRGRQSRRRRRPGRRGRAVRAAALRALEEDGKGLIDGLVVTEPNVVPEDGRFVIRFGDDPPFDPAGRSIYDLMTLMSVYAACAALAPGANGAALVPPHPLAANRCTSLSEKGLVSGATTAEHALSASPRCARTATRKRRTGASPRTTP
jgi:3HB-oligomer hydrolase (3HBOH)